MTLKAKRNRSISIPALFRRHPSARCKGTAPRVAVELLAMNRRSNGDTFMELVNRSDAAKDEKTKCGADC